MSDENSIDAVELATELTMAWLGNPNTRVSSVDVPAFLQAMHAAVADLATAESGKAGGSSPEVFEPAVSARKSLASKDHIISMIDGKPYKTLRRHLSRHGLTPEQYRERYNLRADYPMTSETYSAARREMAKKIGLGRKSGTKAPSPAPASRTGKPRAPRGTAKS